MVTETPVIDPQLVDDYQVAEDAWVCREEPHLGSTSDYQHAHNWFKAGYVAALKASRA